jgi:alanine racemase
VTRLYEATSSEHELRPTHLEVNLAVLRQNYRLIAQSVGGARVMPILKANAYGHGLVSVAKMLEREGVAYVGVAYLEEALRLREEGVCIPVLVLGGIVGDQIPRFIENELTLTASSIDKLTAIEACASRLGRRARVHLKVDTGMERIGVHWATAERLLAHAARAKHVDVEGVFTHFATADEPDLSFSKLQLERFLEVTSFYERHGLKVPLRHAANSGAILRMPESHLDMVRPGILFYGAPPASELPLTIPVQQALRWVTRVVYFKVVGAGPQRQVRRHVCAVHADTRHHTASGLWRWVLARHVRQSGGLGTRHALPRHWADLHGPNHGRYRLEQRFQWRRGRTARSLGQRTHSHRGFGSMGGDHST